MTLEYRCYRYDYRGEKLLQRGKLMDTVVEHVVTAASRVKRWPLIWKTVAIPLLLSTPVERS